MIVGATFRILVISMASLIISTAAFAAAGDAVSTEKKIVSEVQISSIQNDGSYYIKAEGGWGVSGCSGALYAYIDEDSPGADAILSAALTARSTGKPIAIYGICGNPSGNTLYIQIRAVFF